MAVYCMVCCSVRGFLISQSAFIHNRSFSPKPSFKKKRGGGECLFGEFFFVFFESI